MKQATIVHVCLCLCARYVLWIMKFEDTNQIEATHVFIYQTIYRFMLRFKWAQFAPMQRRFMGIGRNTQLIPNLKRMAENWKL